MDQETKTVINYLFAQLSRSAGYLARQEIEALLEKIRADATRLEPYGFKVYSQNDEDGIIQEVCERVGITEGLFVEIGVESGLECNTLFLIHKGWRGHWIEGNAGQRGNIESKFGILLENGRLSVSFEFVSAENINDIFGRLPFDANQIDFLSIDIDGNDIYVLNALNITPKILCIEYNAKFPASIAKQPVYNAKHAWRMTDYMGSSLLAIANVAAKKGYSLVGTNITGANAFFVRKDCMSDKFVSNAAVANLYNPPRYWLTLDHFNQIGFPADFGPYEDLV
jgi:hypothetical protein